MGTILWEHLVATGNEQRHPTDEEIARKLEDALALIREARVAISDASLCIEADHRGKEYHGNVRRELTQVQSHLQLSVIQLDEIGDDYRRGE